MQQKICKCCGKIFEHKNVLKLYCSTECYDKVNRENARKRAKGVQEIEKECLYCGKQFVQRGHKQIFCSPECGKEMRKSPHYKPQQTKKKKKATSLKQMSIEARKHGMSYGKYVALKDMGVKL